MQRKDLSPPFSLLQALEFPCKESEHRLIELAAKSAGLRTPKLVADLVLPDRTSAVPVMSHKPAPQAFPLTNDVPSSGEARKLIRNADASDVSNLRKLLREALLTMDIQNWPGNRSDAQGVLTQIKTALVNPILLSKEATEQMIEEVTKAYENWTAPERTDDKMDLSSYEWVPCQGCVAQRSTRRV